MSTSNMIQIAVLLLLGLASLSPKSFFGMLFLGCAITGGLHFYGWHWETVFLVCISGCFCLPTLRLLMSGRLLVASVILVAVPTLLISHFGFGVIWMRSAVNALVLMLLIPVGILRSLFRLGLLKAPKSTEHSSFHAEYSNFSSSAPTYPSRSESRSR